MTTRFLVLIAMAVAAVGTLAAQQPSSPADQPGARFRSGVDLINVTATVSDASGRFVPGLRQEDFVVYEDGRPQAITYFTAERVPVSLGLVLDTSGSMAGDKIDDAKSALDRFAYDLLDERDELFLYRFSDHPVFVQGWTSDRALLSRAIARVSPDGGTALYDAVMEALPLAATGRHAKKALVVISWQRHLEHRHARRRARAAARERGARLRGRHRRRQPRPVPAIAAAAPRPAPATEPLPAGTRPHPGRTGRTAPGLPADLRPGRRRPLVPGLGQ